MSALCVDGWVYVADSVAGVDCIEDDQEVDMSEEGREGVVAEVDGYELEVGERYSGWKGKSGGGREKVFEN